MQGSLRAGRLFPFTMPGNQAPLPPPLAIGIDVGCSSAVLALFRNGRTEVVSDELGCRSTPCWVHFGEDGVLTGTAAIDVDSPNTIFGFKQIIGLPFSDVKLTSRLRNWPFSILNVRGVPNYDIEVNGQPKLYSPEEVLSLLLNSLKKSAEAFLQSEHFLKTVITVPTYFSDTQRRAMMNAGTLAGLEVIAILNESTAAGLFHSFETGGQAKIVVVFHLDGGSFDVSVIKIEGQELQVLAAGGDAEFGGKPFNDILLNYVLSEIDEILNMKVMALQPDDLRALRTASEKAMEALWTRQQVVVAANLSRLGKAYRKVILRSKFEELCADTFQHCLGVLARVLEEAEIFRHHVDDVVLTGEATRMPQLRGLLQDFFGGKVLYTGANPAEAVARGAAVYASSLLGYGGRVPRAKDVTALSLGIASASGEGLRKELILKNTPLPALATVSVAISSSPIVVWQAGDSGTPSRLIGVLDVGIKPGGCVEQQVKVTFKMESTGMINIRMDDGVDWTLRRDSILSDFEIKQLIAQKKFRKVKAVEWRSNFIQLVEADRLPVITPEAAFMCEICTSIWERENGIVLRECLHTLCRDCVSSIVTHSLTAEVKCPYGGFNYSCVGVLTDCEIRAVVSQPVYEQHIARSLKQAEAEATNKFCCCTLDCPGWCVLDDTSECPGMVREFVCPVCKAINCLNCKVIHTNMTCAQFQQNRIDEARKRKEIELTDQEINCQLQQGLMKNCPYCKVLILKNQGCDHMLCTRCNTRFNWSNLTLIK